MSTATEHAAPPRSRRARWWLLAGAIIGALAGALIGIVYPHWGPLLAVGAFAWALGIEVGVPIGALAGALAFLSTDRVWCWPRRALRLSGALGGETDDRCAVPLGCGSGSFAWRRWCSPREVAGLPFGRAVAPLLGEPQVLRAHLSSGGADVALGESVSTRGGPRAVAVRTAPFAHLLDENERAHHPCTKRIGKKRDHRSDRRGVSCSHGAGSHQRNPVRVGRMRMIGHAPACPCADKRVKRPTDTPDPRGPRS